MVKNPTKNPKKHKLENPDEILPKKRKITEVKTKNKNEKMVIKLYCPAASKIGEIIGCIDEKIDLGTIARMFGVEPGSVKLNGHYISRGVDFIASCVTWNSMLSFFSNKGFLSSAGIIVDGKMLHSGSKRSHEPTVTDKWVDCMQQCEDGEINLPDSKKFKESNNALGRDCQTTARHCETGTKRRHWVEDTSASKKLRVNGDYSNVNLAGSGQNKGSSIGILHCGYHMSENMKRLREDEIIMAASCKKAR